MQLNVIKHYFRTTSCFYNCSDGKTYQKNSEIFFCFLPDKISEDKLGSAYRVRTGSTGTLFTNIGHILVYFALEMWG